MNTRKVFVVIAAQILALFALWAWAYYPFINGKSIVLKFKPYDPRSLVAGQYVDLNLDISTIPTTLFKNHDAKAFITNQIVYTLLKKNQDGYYEAIEAGTKPEKTLSDDEIFIKGSVAYSFEDKVVVKYGLENYFASPDKALEIEKKLTNPKNQGKLMVKVARDGRSVIEDLEIVTSDS